MKTVFVIGAGASKEVKLPVGADLKKHIADSLRSPSKGGEGVIWEALSFLFHRGDAGFDFSQLHLVTARIRDAMPLSISIDNFLDVHAEDTTIVTCGKLAIVHSILKAESKSTIFVDRASASKLQFSGAVEDTWFNRFMQLLTEGCRRSNLVHRLSSIVLIIFNYDRCVEHYICHALQTYYGLSEIEAAELLKSIEIYHPYGTVGSLPHLGRDHPTEFGEIPHASSLPGLAGQIKTFAEGTDKESSDIVAIRQHMDTALRLVFLGFAFHQMNMDLLQPKRQITDRKVFATCRGLSDSKTEMISRRFGYRDPFGNDGLHFRDVTCSQLFQEYSHDFFLT